MRDLENCSLQFIESEIQKRSQNYNLIQKCSITLFDLNLHHLIVFGSVVSPARVVCLRWAGVVLLQCFISIVLLILLLQACVFRDSYGKFKKAGAEVVGISGDDSSSPKAFAKKYKLPFTLLSDEGNKVRKEWRETYVIF
ncbi:unnamed protein product [Trifolium pratense]|uniref:Uncharacterized protein n=1 Tax=Trifolium pratense TaxID=57577 RepID=A0ACB0J3F9_TRIPR|nr:unnamed protein product [Trifolium pratense]